MKSIEINLDKPVGLVSLIFAFGLLFFASEFFWIGFHNIDLVHNYQIINEKFDLGYSIHEMGDHTSSGNVVSLYNIYRTGARQIHYGFGLMFFSGLLFANGVYSISKR